ncbi:MULTISPECIES: DUF2768 family protein [Oceanobacillus]|uniref:DUF2768 family protein n=1 Tax=Oceanobacillus aidingensis TaxID=645964 RepID=A0ABV9K250_9BACI|nr:DUF2768 family protein [Oceanobacillus oncorhynchi]
MNALSVSMLMMYISFVGMFLLILATGLIVWSRTKLRGWFGSIITFLAYISLVSGALIILYVTFSGPTR